MKTGTVAVSKLEDDDFGDEVDATDGGNVDIPDKN